MTCIWLQAAFHEALHWNSFNNFETICNETQYQHNEFYKVVNL